MSTMSTYCISKLTAGVDIIKSKQHALQKPAGIQLGICLGAIK